MKLERERVTFWGLVATLLATTAAAYVLVLGPEPGTGEVMAATRANGASAAAPAEPPEGGAATLAAEAGGAFARVAARAGVPVPPAVPVVSVGGAPADVAPADPALAALAVATIDGDVTLVRRGIASPAQPGDPVRPGDALVTAAGARAILAGGACALTLEEGGRIEVKESTPARARLRLESGIAEASVRGTGRWVEIESALDAVARTSGGTLHVARSGRLVAAAVLAGEAELRAAGAAVPLGVGEGSSVLDGGAPEPPAPVPTSLALEVEWPRLGRRGRTREPRVVLQGQTAPGAIVFVGGERLEVAPDGRFVGEISLREGPQRLAARALAAGDLRAAVEGPRAILDTTAPEPKFDTRRLWTRQ